MSLRTKAFVAVLLAGVLLAAACGPKNVKDWGDANTPPVKIKVVAAKAVLRLSPDPKADIVADKVAVGKIFEGAKKAGDWYEVQHRSEMGMLLTAYIAAADVVVVAPPAPPKK